MGDRRGPPDYGSYPPSRDYDRRGPPPPVGDYRSERRPPPPQSMRSPLGYDHRDGPLPPASARRDSYDDYRGAPIPHPSSLDGRGKRRRSLSPGPPPRRGDYHEPYPPRDGYRPAPGYRGDYPPPRPHSPPYRGPPASGAYYGRPPPPVPAQREIEAPHHLPYVVTHRYFSDWFTRTNPSSSLADSPEALELAWKKYLAEYMRTSLRPHFEEMKGLKWFQEKYAVGPEWESERDKRTEQGRRGRILEWCQLAEQGEWQGVSNEFDESSTTTTSKKSEPTSDQNGDATMADPQVDKEDKEKKAQVPLGDGLLSLTPESVLIPSRPNRVVIESIPSNIAYSEIHALLNPLDGFVVLSTGDGDATENWVRTGWATFETEEQAVKAMDLLSEAMIGEYKFLLSRQDQPREVKIRAAPAAMSTPDRIKKDLTTVENIIEFLERSTEEEKKGSAVIRERKEGWMKQVEDKKERGEDAKEEEHEANRKTLDLSLHYLRFAFNTCYYCATRCQSADALEAVCPRHVRRAGPALPSDVPFVEGLDEKLPLLDDLEKLDLRDFGAELKEETLFNLCSPYIKNEEEGKFRCKECNKLFSARKFVEKHIVTKHGQFVNDALVQVQYFNNYILDPAHHPRSEFQSMNFIPSLVVPPPAPVPALADRIGGRRTNGSTPDKRQKRDGPPPPPPKGAVLDPRAARAPSSYADLDGTPGGLPDVVELPY